MMDRYRQTFDAMTPAAAHHLWGAVLRRHPTLMPPPPADCSGGALFAACASAGLGQCEVVMSVAPDPDPLATEVIEAHIGRPLRVERRPECQPPARAAREKRERAARSVEARGSDPRIVVSVVQNPRREGSAAHAGYSHWTVGRTVDECIAAGLPTRYVRKDTGLGRVKLGPPKEKKV